MQLHLPGRSVGAVTLLCAGLLVAAEIAVFLSVFRNAPKPTVVAGDAVAPSGDLKAANWIYGDAEARFTLIEYADLECPYCATSFFLIQSRIDTHPDVSWQWRHLPLTIHEPEATQAARVAECAGVTEGNAAFWKAIGRQYARWQNSPVEQEPTMCAFVAAAFGECLLSNRPDRVIEAHRTEAAQKGIEATPTMILRDTQSGKSLKLIGAPSGDALLSALDALIAF